MITTDLKFSRPPENVTLLKAHSIISTPAEDNISNIVYKYSNRDKHIYEVTLSAPVNKYYEGMMAEVSQTIYYDGIHKIIKVNNNVITIESPIYSKTTVSSGKFKLTGVIPLGESIKGNLIFNNDNKIIGYKYSGNNTFLIDISRDTKDNSSFAIQAISIDSALSATLKWSLNGVNWLDFDTEITLTCSDTGSAGIILKDVPAIMKLKLTVVSTGTYYFIAG